MNKPIMYCLCTPSFSQMNSKSTMRVPDDHPLSPNYNGGSKKQSVNSAAAQIARFRPQQPLYEVSITYWFHSAFINVTDFGLPNPERYWGSHTHESRAKTYEAIEGLLYNDPVFNRMENDKRPMFRHIPEPLAVNQRRQSMDGVDYTQAEVIQVISHCVKSIAHHGVAHLKDYESDNYQIRILGANRRYIIKEFAVFQKVAWKELLDEYCTQIAKDHILAEMIEMDMTNEEPIVFRR